MKDVPLCVLLLEDALNGWRQVLVLMSCISVVLVF